MEDVKKLATELANMWLNSYEKYKPIVEDVCSRPISEKELTYILDDLLDVCAYDKNYELFSELCETYESIYPECVHDYLILYTNTFETEDI